MNSAVPDVSAFPVPLRRVAIDRTASRMSIPKAAESLRREATFAVSEIVDRLRPEHIEVRWWLTAAGASETEANDQRDARPVFSHRFAIGCGRRGPTVTPSQDATVHLNGWLLAPTVPRALRDGDTLADGDRAWRAHVEPAVPCVVTFGLARFSAPPHAFCDRTHFRILPNDEPICVTLDEGLVGGLLDVLVGDGGARPFDDVPHDEIGAAVVDWVIARSVNHLGRIVFGAERSIVRAANESALPLTWVCVVTTVGGYAGSIWIGTTAAGLGAVMAAAQARDVRAGTSALRTETLAHVRVPAVVRRSLCLERADALAMLEAGDIVCSSVQRGKEALLSLNGEALLDVGTAAVTLHVSIMRSDDGRSLRLNTLGFSTKGTVDILDAWKRDDENSAPASVEDVVAGTPVTVSVELARVSLTIGELCALAEGQTIELDAIVSPAVTLLANGSRIARGELVDVDGHFGVRVISVGEAAW